jgi:3-isopropylmalate/(R)-2-methylmalate dehydratase small subunit
MEPFRRLDAVACPLPLANIDTDQLVPARFMSRPRGQGYGDVLLHDLRRDGDGRLRAELALNDPVRAGAAILVTRRNFGAGSSREAAVYALRDAGFRCVVASSFGDIFAANAVNNGLLPARVDDVAGERLLAVLADGLTSLAVDLETCRITGHEIDVAFAIDPVWRVKLLNGWDDLDLTDRHAAAIAAFAAADAVRRPWAQPRRDGS